MVHPSSVTLTGYGYPYAYGGYHSAAYAYGAYPYAAYGAYPYAAAVPFGSSTGLDPITQGLDPVTQGHAIPHYGYAGYGYGHGYGYAAYPYSHYGAYAWGK